MLGAYSRWRPPPGPRCRAARPELCGDPSGQHQWQVSAGQTPQRLDFCQNSFHPDEGNSVLQQDVPAQTTGRLSQAERLAPRPWAQFPHPDLEIPARSLLDKEAVTLQKDPTHQQRTQRPDGLGQTGLCPRPTTGASSSAGLAVPGCITQQAAVTPAGTVPACSARQPACRSPKTLFAGTMYHAAESPGRLLLRLGVGVSPGAWTALLAICPYPAGLRSEQVQV